MNLRLPLLVLVASVATVIAMGVVWLFPAEPPSRPRLSASEVAVRPPGPVTGPVRAEASPAGAARAGAARAGAVQAEASPAGAARAGAARAEAARALSVLRAWDGRRARAWSRGDVAGLRALYLPQSRAGVRDARMLGRWRSRGLHVVGMQTQVLEVSRAEVTRGRVLLVVTDRLVGARAVGRGRPLALPADAPSTRRIVLRRVQRGGPAGWVVAAVATAAPSRAPR